jgi:hypothetical protein
VNKKAAMIFSTRISKIRQKIKIIMMLMILKLLPLVVMVTTTMVRSRK